NRKAGSDPGYFRKQFQPGLNTGRIGTQLIIEEEEVGKLVHIFQTGFCIGKRTYPYLAFEFIMQVFFQSHAKKAVVIDQKNIK
ncbi:MAG TPA: hypothetical protein VNZ45_15800, partial [Bacteroidia bacterium]|nr:hypothetical protein [Bacteroidia bacterium]